jgi:hypothetical protein
MNQSTLHITSNQPVFTLTVGGEDILFEKHYLGPMPCTKTGAERRLANNHPFWEAVSHWYEQGCKAIDGKCVWSKPPDEDADFELVHLAGRHYTLRPKSAIGPTRLEVLRDEVQAKIEKRANLI